MSYILHSDLFQANTKSNMYALCVIYLAFHSLRFVTFLGARSPVQIQMRKIQTVSDNPQEHEGMSRWLRWVLGSNRNAQGDDSDKYSSSEVTVGNRFLSLCRGLARRGACFRCVRCALPFLRSIVSRFERTSVLSTGCTFHRWYACVVSCVSKICFKYRAVKSGCIYRLFFLQHLFEFMCLLWLALILKDEYFT